MGQQQLLLVILVTIIVGIATVVAINIFGTAADQANVDAVRQDLMAAAVQAQAVWSRPTMMNGADRDFGTFGAADVLERLNIPNTDPDYTPGTDTELSNENGRYVVATSGTSTLTITGYPSSDPGNGIVATVERDSDDGTWDVTLADATSTTTTGEGE